MFGRMAPGPDAQGKDHDNLEVALANHTLPELAPRPHHPSHFTSVYHQGEIYIQEERMIFPHDAMARAHKDERNLIPFTNSHRPLKTPLSRTLTTK